MENDRKINVPRISFFTFKMLNHVNVSPTLKKKKKSIFMLQTEQRKITQKKTWLCPGRCGDSHLLALDCRFRSHLFASQGTAAQHLASWVDAFLFSVLRAPLSSQLRTPLSTPQKQCWSFPKRLWNGWHGQWVGWWPPGARLCGSQHCHSHCHLCPEHQGPASPS